MPWPSEKIDELKNELVAKINKKFPNNALPKSIDIKIGLEDLPPKMVGKYDEASHRITIHPRALDDQVYFRYVMLHELIHAASEEYCDCENHHEEFMSMANELGLPEKYRD